MTEPRRYLTPKQKAQVREEQGGMCFLCHEPLDQSPNDPTDYDHIIARGYGGSDELENFCATHKSCHRAPGGKTSQDRKIIAKCNRLRKKHGTDGEKVTKRKGRTLQSRGFPDNLRRKLDGTVEVRR